MLILNGQLFEAGAPEITLLNRSFKYGDSLFESMRVFEGRVLFMDQHFQRLSAGMKVLRMDFQPTEFEATLYREIQRLLQVNQVDEHGYVRLQVYRAGAGTYAPIQNHPYFLIEAYSLKEDTFQSSVPIHLRAYHDIPIHYDALSPFKTGNALPYVLAGLFAREQGADDAVLFNDQWVADTAGANVFMVRQRKIFTPPLSSGCLDGIMRKQVIQLCQELKLDFSEKRLRKKDLMQADEIFLTNSIRGIIGVGHFENEEMPTDRPLTTFLRNCLQQYILRQQNQ
jgi:branched-subunit amino acid aminotransferase/4-amino-4-deoxychorismate lyase